MWKTLHLGAFVALACPARDAAMDGSRHNQPAKPVTCCTRPTALHAAVVTQPTGLHAAVWHTYIEQWLLVQEHH
jgi:hypothetical protein